MVKKLQPDIFSNALTAWHPDHIEPPLLIKFFKELIHAGPHKSGSAWGKIYTSIVPLALPHSGRKVGLAFNTYELVGMPALL